jgi:large subunit ribosomal protein L11
MAKEIVERFRMQVPAGQATPGPPVGVALGPRNVNPGAFCKQFNDQTRDLQGTPVTVEMIIFRDRSFDFNVLGPPASVLLKRAANIVKGSGEPNREKVGSVTGAQLEEIAKEKMKDLNADSLEAAVKQLEGTARSMGIVIGEPGEVELTPPEEETKGAGGTEAEATEGTEKNEA